MPEKNIETATVHDIQKLTSNVYRIRLSGVFIHKRIKPGQFVNLSLSGCSGHLLKRPFSVHRIHDNGIEILFKEKGAVTRAMTGLMSGDACELLGPLGTPYSLCRQKKVLLIGGGIGIAPLISLYDSLTPLKNNIVLD